MNYNLIFGYKQVNYNEIFAYKQVNYNLIFGYKQVNYNLIIVERKSKEVNICTQIWSKLMAN